MREFNDEEIDLNNIICLVQKSMEYPCAEYNFSPSIVYPEYPWKKEISDGENKVYDLLREAFFLLGFDKEKYGTPEWNPLGAVIKKGESVLIKPNLVNHINENKYADLDCVVTNPALIRCVIDYLVIAGAGKILVGDAPIQVCDFDKLYHKYHYTDIVDFYKKKGINIEFLDFRNTISKLEKGILKARMSGDVNSTILFNLDKDSFFIDKKLSDNYETCGYINKNVRRHHQGTRHEYLVHRAVIEADVIINMPKPKTHRFAGLTGAQKNFVGICPDKEYLPHYTEGTQEERGDETDSSKLIAKWISISYKKFLEYSHEQKIFLGFSARAIHKIFNMINRNKVHTKGAWYGNDTIWRTLLDLNKIVLYGQSDGWLDYNKRKRVLTIGDMVVAGEKEGPLAPSPKKLGIILVSKDLVVFDYVFCKIAGFDYHKIPTIVQSIKNKRLCCYDLESIKLNSNLPGLNKKKISDMETKDEWRFQCHSFWKEILGR